MVRQHRPRDLPRRSDDVAVHAEAVLERDPEPAEQVDMLGLLAGELQEGADPAAVAVQMRAGVIQHEGQDELLDQTSGSTRASGSGRNGFVKSRRLSPPMMSSTRQ